MRLHFLRRRAASTPKHIDSGVATKSHATGDAMDAARAFAPVALTALMQSADVFPPLKSAVGFLLQVHDICERMKCNREGADELRIRVESIRDYVADAFQDEKDVGSELYSTLIRFDQSLTNLLIAVDRIRWRRSRVLRFAHAVQDAESLGCVKERLDDSTKLLMLIITMHHVKALRSISTTVDKTELSVARVESLVMEVGYMRTQLAQARRLFGVFFFF
ncbi:hypothetical protein BD410DRAFT_642783 [Rickenella mellea]|uniref:Mixed lineage kinase domain-containing protein n=1 Tax=Rickenella mellea TaxID=50990 RepID=A0A4Y7PP63_9AGAM|nr:hypothetical protein BD410DRAFT_642783 [Rickenella mellea]